MRREDITLRRAARRGDTQAMLEIAERYLMGVGVPRHVVLGLQYLKAHRTTPDAAALACKCLGLDELIEHDQLDLLPIAAALSTKVRAKLAVWRILEGEVSEGVEMLQGCKPVGMDLPKIQSEPPDRQLTTLLKCLAELGEINGSVVALAAAKRACGQENLPRLCILLHAATELRASVRATNAWIFKAVALSEAQDIPIQHLKPQDVQGALEQAATDMNPQAWFILGRALCGLPCGPNPANNLVKRENLRKGTAFLLRAADAGYTQAWLHLYRLNSNARCSVANPEMARFCLEKAAAAGHPEAQRRLGALILRESTAVQTMEQAITWLHLAAAQNDLYAQDLLRSLVLPVQGDVDEAESSLARVQQVDAWLAARLRLAREFGLTKQEALALDPASAARPWGLVTGFNPHLTQSKLSAPRLVPATTPTAQEALRQAVTLFSLSDQDSHVQRRSSVQRRRLALLDIDEDLFFADANSNERDRVRIGTRWAHHARTRLQAALA